MRVPCISFVPSICAVCRVSELIYTHVKGNYIIIPLTKNEEIPKKLSLFEAILFWPFELQLTCEKYKRRNLQAIGNPGLEHREDRASTEDECALKRRVKM